MVYRSRALLVIALLATATAAIAGLRWTTWIPVTACLLCDARNADDGAAARAGASVGTTGGIGVSAHSSAALSNPGPLIAPPAASQTPGAESPIARLGSAPRGWQPWSASSGAFRVSASASSGPSTSLGGLWRLMNLSRPPAITSNAGETPAAHTPAPIATRPAPSAATPAPGGRTTPKPAPSPSGGGASTTSAPSPGLAAPAPGAGSSSEGSASGSTGGGPGTGGTGTGGGGATGGVPPLDPFHEHEEPAPDPFGGPSGGGGFDPGGSGAPPSGGGVSATPEPGSVLLVGTGLLGILGALRKRRLI